jgi:hypothetical protein
VLCVFGVECLLRPLPLRRSYSVYNVYPYVLRIVSVCLVAARVHTSLAQYLGVAGAWGGLLTLRQGIFSRLSQMRAVGWSGWEGYQGGRMASCLAGVVLGCGQHGWLVPGWVQPSRGGLQQPGVTLTHPGVRLTHRGVTLTHPNPSCTCPAGTRLNVRLNLLVWTCPLHGRHAVCA